MVKARYRVLVFALCVICLLLPGVVGKGQEGTQACPKPFIRSISSQACRRGDLLIIRGVRFGMPRGDVLFSEAPHSPMDLLVVPTAKAEIISWTFHRISLIVPKSAATGYFLVRVHCGEESNKINFTVNE